MDSISMRDLTAALSHALGMEPGLDSVELDALVQRVVARMLDIRACEWEYARGSRKGSVCEKPAQASRWCPLHRVCGARSCEPPLPPVLRCTYTLTRGRRSGECCNNKARQGNPLRCQAHK